LIPSHRIVIESGRSERQYWRDLWRYRELLFFLSWRDVSVRYKQTVIGLAWAVVRPVATMVVFVVVFGKVAKLPDAGVPYPLLVLCGMLAWQLFASGFSAASDSLVSNANLISKVYFPRLLVPISSVATAVVDFLVTLPVLAALMLWYGHVPGWQVVFFPAFVLLAVAAAMAVGVWFGALNVRFRDVRQLIPFLVQFGIYVTPVGFAAAAVPEQYRRLIELNPLTGIVEGFRWSLLGGTGGLTPFALGWSVAVVAVALVTGVRYFRATERTFADVI
jgi:lipopolysaccharide transport system permease protein